MSLQAKAVNTPTQSVGNPASSISSNDSSSNETVTSATKARYTEDSHNQRLETGIYDDSEAHKEQEVLNLARKFTTRSTDSHHQPLFGPTPGKKVDPQSPDFSAKSWAKAFYNVRYNAEANSEPRLSGFAFKGLQVYGYGTATDYQMSVGNALLKLPSMALHFLTGKRGQRVDILQEFDGLVLPGEQLCVLGPPGSGCSTLLKTIAGDTHGFEVHPDSYINYHGITPRQMTTAFRGEAIYTAEVDTHFPMLSVGDTLYFAALSRAPYQIPGGISRSEYATHLRDVIMAMFGISHTINTRVGNDFVRGVSGGERKRVTISEAALSYAPLQCWDNSTRGLDSANAVEFCRTLRTQSDVFGTTSCIAIYQAPQAAYEVCGACIVYDAKFVLTSRPGVR